MNVYVFINYNIDYLPFRLRSHFKEMFHTIPGTSKVSKTNFSSAMTGDCVNFLMTNFGDCVIPYCIISTLQPTNNNDF